MIDPKELKIGNWITDKGGGQLVKVWHLEENWINEKFKDEFMGVILSPSLMRQLFKYVNAGEIRINYGIRGYFTLRKYRDEWKVMNNGLSHVPYFKYLHKLQNFYFAATSVELEIQL